MPKKFISNGELRSLLSQATEEERLALTKLLKPKKDVAYGANKLQKKICLEGGHGVANWYRDQGTGYLDIIDDVLDQLEIDGLPSYSDKVSHYDELKPVGNDVLSLVNLDSKPKYKKSKARKKGLKYAEKAEEQIILSLLKKAYESMDDKAKKTFDEQIRFVAKKYESSSMINVAGVAGIMALGNIGGFATYTFLTTTMSTLTMGALGFGAYTAATSFLSVILGPVGWVGLGSYATYTYGSPDYNKMIPIVATIGVIRQRIKYESN